MSPRLLLHLVWLPLAVAVLFVVRQDEAARSFHHPQLVLNERGASDGATVNSPKCQPPAPGDILQFASGGHVLGFSADAIYVASGSQALRVQFVDPRATNPVSTVLPGGAQRAAPLSQVT